MSRFFIIIALGIHFYLIFNSPKYDRATEPYIPPPQIIQHFHAGFKPQMADSFWLRAVQDFDHCSEKIKENECVGKSWLSQVLDLASVLDPKLEPVMYQTGGLALTILISDYAGASSFFDKGVRIYPNNWQLQYTAAYHALYEEKNKAKAARLYMRAYENGAPSWVWQMATRLAAEGGDTEYAQKILEDMIAQNKDEKIVARLKAKLEQSKSSRKNNWQK